MLAGLIQKINRQKRQREWRTFYLESRLSRSFFQIKVLGSLVLDHYGWFHMPVHAINLWRIAGAALMIGGISLIVRH